MTIKIHCVPTYTIDDHPNKEAVYDWVRDNWHDLYGWHDENRESIEAFAASFGASVKFEYGFSSYSYADFSGIDDDILSLSGVRLWKWLNNNGHFDKLDGSCPFTGYYMDETLLDPIRQFKAKPDKRDLEDLLSDCGGAWVKACLKDWEYAYTDEAIHEHLEANEYEFTESGAFYH